MSYKFSLHRTRSAAKCCEVCGGGIPVRKRPDYAEYWRVKGGPHGSAAPRVICCMCHAIYDLPTDGWEVSPDGRDTFAALMPVRRGPHIGSPR